MNSNNNSKNGNNGDPFAGIEDLQMTSNFPTSERNIAYAPPTISQETAPNHNPSSSTRWIQSFTNCIVNTFTFLQKSSHPIPAAFHILFKIAAITLYLIGGFFNGNSSNFVFIAVICILLHACDFWVVKNVTGRLLVGLRWWNKVHPDDGSTEWIYESSQEGTKNINAVDSNYFWTVMYITPLIWTVFGVICILKLNLSWLLIVMCALALNGANLYGYWMCSKDQKQKMKDMMAKASFGAASSAWFGFRGSSQSSSSVSHIV